MKNEDIINRCQNCGGARKEHRKNKCPTRLTDTTWKPWTVAEYEAAKVMGQTAAGLKTCGCPGDLAPGVQKLTDRQRAVLDHLRALRVTSSGSDGAVLRALEAKGYVTRHHFSQGQNVYYTWTLTAAGTAVADDLARQEHRMGCESVADDIARHYLDTNPHLSCVFVRPPSGEVPDDNWARCKGCNKEFAPGKLSAGRCEACYGVFCNFNVDVEDPNFGPDRRNN